MVGQRLLFLRNLFFLAIVISPVTFADHSVQLNKKEQAFLAQHPNIVLGTTPQWEPYSIVNPDGSISGYNTDVLKRINHLTGANFTLLAVDSLDILDKVKSRKLDGLSTGKIDKESGKYLLFSDFYLSLNKMLLVLKGNPKDIHSTTDLHGKSIAILNDNLVDEHLATQYPQSTIIKVDNINTMIDAVISGRVDAVFGNGATLYVANKLQIPYLEPAFILKDHFNLAFGVRNDWPEALSILNKGLHAIGESERIRLQNKWFHDNIVFSVKSIELTVEEIHFLDHKEFIAMCTDPDWMPYEQITKEGLHEGILGDYHRLWSQKIGKEIRLINTESWMQSLEYMKQGRCDILSSAHSTQERQHYMSFTAPFVWYPIVVATRNDELFFESFEQLLPYKLAIVKGYSTIETLKYTYPEIKILEVKNALEGLLKVSKGEAFGYIDTVATIGYQSQKHGILNIKISGVLDEKYYMSVAVRNDEPLLLSIFDKAVASLTNHERNDILNRWISIKYEKIANHTNYWIFIGCIIIVLLLLLYRERFISRYSRRLQLMNQELERFSKTDPLTGVANRHSLADFFGKEVARNKRYHSDFSVVMVDIDHFKKVNDQYGHNVGDRVLIEIAKILSANVRENDVVGRWGGEEFIILCPQTNKNGVLKMAESLRLKIAHNDFANAGTLTASFGVSIYGKDETMEAFIKRVDDALYEAKDTGRNSVKFH